jgi:hypothetical protein
MRQVLTSHSSLPLAQGGSLDPSGLYTLLTGNWVRVLLAVTALFLLAKAMKGDFSRIATVVGLSIVGLGWLALSADSGAGLALGKHVLSLVGLGGGN